MQLRALASESMADNEQKPTLSETDANLMRAWDLGMGEGGWSDAVMDEAERLLPSLLTAGYVEADGSTWRFSAAGVARAEALEGIATQPTQPKGIDPKTGKPYEPVEIPVPKRGTWDRLLKLAENTPLKHD
jgi:hypothetical protein